MNIRMKLICVGLALASLGILNATPVFAQGSETSNNVINGRRPRLVVLVSIDQFRADYIRRLVGLYLPPHPTRDTVGGFRYLMAEGSDFLDARHQHFPLYTGPGHAALLTGGYPYKTGIISNDWWDRTAHAQVYCVDDPRQTVVGALPTSHVTPMGPLKLKSTTVGDELKLATAGRAKVVTLSLKDRAAILMGGHMQDVCLWFDPEGGRWISSTAYCRNGKLPDWVDGLNREAIPDKTLGTTWTPSVSAETLARYSFEPARQAGAKIGGIGPSFPHAIGSAKTTENYSEFTLTPDANAFVIATAERAVTAEKLGQRGDVSDLLALNLATNDYVGHVYGPYSPEALDIAVQTDRRLSEFLNFLAHAVPGGLKNIDFVVTADHGVAPMPEDSLRFNLTTNGRTSPAPIPEAVQKALAARFGDDTYIETSADGKKNSGYIEDFVYLSDDAVARALQSGKAVSRAQMEDAARDAVDALHLPGIYAVYTRAQVLSGALPNNDLSRHLENGAHPSLWGDLVLIDDPLHLSTLTTSTDTSHGTPYAYDTHVPLLIAGFGITQGTWADPVSPADIAPTLCTLLGIEFPSGCDGHILKQALR